VGQEVRGDNGSVRFYTHNYLQARLYKGGEKSAVRSLGGHGRAAKTN